MCALGVLYVTPLMGDRTHLAVSRETIQSNNNRYPKEMNILDVFLKVHEPGGQQLEVLLGVHWVQRLAGGDRWTSAVHL